MWPADRILFSGKGFKALRTRHGPCLEPVHDLAQHDLANGGGDEIVERVGDSKPETVARVLLGDQGRRAFARPVRAGRRPPPWVGGLWAWGLMGHESSAKASGCPEDGRLRTRRRRRREVPVRVGRRSGRPELRLLDPGRCKAWQLGRHSEVREDPSRDRSRLDGRDHSPSTAASADEPLEGWGNTASTLLPIVNYEPGRGGR